MIGFAPPSPMKTGTAQQQQPSPDQDPSQQTGAGHTASGHTGTSHTGTAQTATATTVGGGQTRLDATSLTLSNLTGPAEKPDLDAVRGLRLSQQLLAGVVLLVVVVVGLSGAVSITAVQRQFRETGEYYKARFESQARELGATISHTVSLSSAGSLRDNNYGLLSDLVKDITQDNPNIVRLRILDVDGVSVADSDSKAQLGTAEKRTLERSWTTTAYAGKPVFEYQEPIDYGSESGKGLVVLNYSLEQLERQLRELEDAKRDAISAATRRTGLLAAAFILLGVLGAIFQSRRIGRSLEALTSGAMQLAAGDLNTRVQEASGAAREVRTLSRVFNYMGARLSALMESARSRAVLEREVQLARQVQNTLMPSREPLVFGNVRIAGACITADACGGDWWMYSQLDAQRLVLGIGDVTGHGLSSALIATSATSGFAAAMKLREPEDLNAVLLISSLNQTLFSIAHGQHQMSSALGILNVHTGELEYAAGGHPSAATVNRGTLQPGTLPARGALLGASEGSNYQARKAQLQRGDVVVWYTDGLTEARDPSGRLYGTQRLYTVLQAHATQSAELIRDAILADVNSYTEGRAQQDDITVVVLEFAAP